MDYSGAVITMVYKIFCVSQQNPSDEGSGLFYLILWVICGISYLVFRKKYKAQDDEAREKARAVQAKAREARKQKREEKKKVS